MRFSLKLIGLFLLSGLLLASIGTQGYARNGISPVVPSIASFILPGAGQLINNQVNKAVIHFIVGAAIGSTYSFTLFSGGETVVYYNLVPVLHLAWSGYSAYDAYQVASGRWHNTFGSTLELDSSKSTQTDLELASSALSISETSREFSVSAVDQ